MLAKEQLDLRIESRITSVVNGRQWSYRSKGLHPDNGKPTFLLKLKTLTVTIEIINIEFFLFGIHRCMNADLVVHTSMNTKQKEFNIYNVNRYCQCL